MTAVIFDQDWRYWRRGETTDVDDGMADMLTDNGIARHVKAVTEKMPERHDKMVRDEQSEQKHEMRRRKDKRRMKNHKAASADPR